MFVGRSGWGGWSGGVGGFTDLRHAVEAPTHSLAYGNPATVFLPANDVTG